MIFKNQLEWEQKKPRENVENYSQLGIIRKRRIYGTQQQQTNEEKKYHGPWTTGKECETDPLRAGQTLWEAKASGDEDRLCKALKKKLWGREK